MLRISDIQRTLAGGLQPNEVVQTPDYGALWEPSFGTFTGMSSKLREDPEVGPDALEGLYILPHLGRGMSRVPW